MTRLTRKHVESLITQLNEVLDRPTTPFHYDENGRYVQNVNHIYLDQFNEKYCRLCVMCKHGNADLGSGGTLSEIEKYVRGMLTMHYGLKDYTKDTTY